MTDDELRADVMKAIVLAILVLLLCYILKGTDWQREQSIFTELQDHMAETAD